jgi:hypothetical protein
MTGQTVNGRTHTYHAEAKVIEGHLQLPLVQEIKPQAHAYLPPHGGYGSQRSEGFRVEEVLSYRSGHTQVGGNRSPKATEGWSTLTSFVVEGLNVLDVLTADRVVGQIVTDHPLKGYVPTISFLGTRFDNLRIAGHPVHLELDLGILGPKPQDDKPYGLDADIKKRITAQYNRILGSPNLPGEERERYNQLSSTLGRAEAVECSLVNNAPGGYPGACFGHRIHVPNFGWITLAKVRSTYKEVKEGNELHKRTTVHLSMIELCLGCAASGSGTIASGSSNGQTVP